VELPAHFPSLTESPEVLTKLIHEENQLLGQADLVLTHSHTGLRYLLQRRVPAERIATVPNAVDPDLFSPGSAPLTGEVPFRLAYTGTLAPWQGLGTLVEALAPMRHEPVEVDVIGPRKSAWRRELRSLARQARVHHMLRLSEPTDQTNLIPVLRRAHICVAPLPSDPRNALQGCCPIKVLEYMAVGRPVLATRIAPITEMVCHRESAFLVQAGSPAALADGVQWLRAHPDECETIGRAARDVVLARFTPELFRSRLGAALDVVGLA
jgi:glycosyltransferase involved in cell wall biosynthesis